MHHRDQRTSHFHSPHDALRFDRVVRFSDLELVLAWRTDGVGDERFLGVWEGDVERGVAVALVVEGFAFED